MNEYNGYSSIDLVRLLGERFKTYRLRLQLTQKEVAEKAGLSPLTIHRFENGKAPNLSLSVFLLLMKTIGIIDNIDKMLPTLDKSPYLYTDNYKTVQRIKHKKQTT